MPAERVRRFLLEHGIPYTTDTHPVAYTAREAAQVEQRCETTMVRGLEPASEKACRRLGFA